MKCRHEKQRYLVATVYVPSDMMTPAEIAKGDPVQLVGQRRCEQCGEIVILGPSNDSDARVQLEMRAAEIVAEGRVASCMDHDREWLDCERCGWLNWNDNRPELRDDIYTDAWWAGYLARCSTEGDE